MPRRTQNAACLGVVAPEPGKFPSESAAILNGFLDYLQVECGLAINTCQAYRRDLTDFLNFLASCGIKSFAKLSSEHIEKFLHHCRKRGLSVSSAARAMAAVRMFCRYLVIERMLQRDVSDCIDTPKKWNRLPSVLNEVDVEKLLQSPADQEDIYAQRDRAMLKLLYATGMRASELAGLKINDINTSLGIIRVFGKGNKERIVPVAESAMNAVNEYLLNRRNAVLKDSFQESLFLSRSGKPLNREDVFRTIRKYVNKTALRGNVTPHTLRHCFATHMLSNGADLRSVQELLGHANIATTQIYTHVDASRLKSIHRQFHPRG